MDNFCDESSFQGAVQQSLKNGEKLKAQEAARKECVRGRLKEEINRLGPHRERLLSGHP